jgi:hypothetical protein
VSKLSAQIKPIGTNRSPRMLDLVMVALGLAFFALSVGYTIACDRL